MMRQMKRQINKIVAAFSRDSAYRKALSLPEKITEEYLMLAQGEYNVNYSFVHPISDKELVMRINVGSQMHLRGQIEYEAHALKLIEGSGRTPKVLYVDGSRRLSDYGMLVMEYIPGDYLDYTNADEMNAAMECLADIHSMRISEDEVIWGEPASVPRDTTKLIAPADSAGAILDECEIMVSKYMRSSLGDESIKRRLRFLLDKAYEIAKSTKEPVANNYRCCINTELNSTNFLIEKNGQSRKACLVDWEKPLYGDPAQDLGHMLAPTTTFWKTDTVLSPKEINRYIDEYIRAVSGRFDTSCLKERTMRLIKITCMRGLTWCAMAWIEYKNPEKTIVNDSTREKLDDYLSDDFLDRIEKLLSD